MKKKDLLILFMIITQEFINSGDSLYLVHRKIKVSTLEKLNNDQINELNDFYNCDKVFKKDDNYLFVRSVEEATII